MCIYINTNGHRITLNGLDLMNYIKRKGIEPHTDYNNLEEIEDNCCACIIDLTAFDSVYINLKSGMDIGLAKWFEYLTLLIVDPSNEDLKRDLNSLGSNIYIFSEDLIRDNLDQLLDTIMKFKSNLDEFRPETLDTRKKARRMLWKTFEGAFTESRNMVLLDEAERKLVNR
jgi:hypothetical protein